MSPSKAVLKHWQATQAHWNDDAFLAETANAFMRLRWRRLNESSAAWFGARARENAQGLDLIDVGCAHADFETFVRPQLRSYTGIEPSKALLPKDRSQGKAFRLKRGQAERLPLPKDCADALLLKEVLDHCYDPKKVLGEAARVLRPGGWILITLTNDHAWYKRLFPKWAGRIKASQDDHLNFFSPDWVAHLLAQAGFEALGGDDSHYLRLPYRVEEPLGRLPAAFGKAVIGASDAVGSLIAPGMGGSFWAWGRKLLKGKR
jgi:ubiquinone/menaquinone biosynthesis C-methylase UbiE